MLWLVTRLWRWRSRSGDTVVRRRDHAWHAVQAAEHRAAQRRLLDEAARQRAGSHWGNEPTMPYPNTRPFTYGQQVGPGAPDQPVTTMDGDRSTRRERRAATVLPVRMDGCEHLPARPSWDCLACDGETPWPCDPARVRLAEAYRGDRVGLAMYVAVLLEQAAAEIPERVGPAELYERFVAWTR